MNPVHAVPEGRTGWMTEEMTDCEIDLRKQAWAIWQLLKEKVPGFENSFIEKTPQPAHLPRAPHRRRARGDCELRCARARPSTIPSRSTTCRRTSTRRSADSGYEILPHDIPYRSLVSKGIDNLLAAGMTMSCGAFAMAGLRYCTPSICTGQAAGTAAALASKNNVSPKKLDVKLLQDALRKQGARVTVKDVPAEALEPYRFIQKLGIVLERTPGAKLDVTEEEIGRY